MAYDPSIFNINPYYDDFDGDRGFLRVLFKPGYAVQARELTQLQSILQNQLSKIGDHLFKDGSRIVGGGISVRNASYAMLSVQEGSPLRGLSDYSFLLGGFLISPSGSRAKVVHYIPPDSTDGNLIVVVDFVSGETFGNTTLIRFEKENTPLITNISVRAGVSYPVEGACKLVSVSDGIFYVDGFFVRVSASVFAPFQSMGSYRDLSFSGFEALSKRIGFSVSRDSVTDSEDSTLRDPSIGSYNYNAPGADRYRISLVLAQTDIDVDTVDFVELLRFESGRITKKIDRISYGEIQKALALRTYDESGSYAVTPFDVVTKTQSDETLALSVGKGKAYVLGYEVDNEYPVSVPLPKARTIQTETNLRFPYTVGNYVSVEMSDATLLPTFAGNLPTIGAGSCRVVFRSGTGAVVAEGNVHGVIPDLSVLTGTNYRLYVYGLSGSLPLDAAPGIGHLYQHGNGATIGYFSSNSPISPVNSDASSLVYEMKPGYAVSGVSRLTVPAKIIGDGAITVTQSGNNTTYSFNKSNFAATISSANASAFSFFPYGNGEFSNSVDVSEISFVRATDGAAFTPNSGTLTNNNQTVSLTVTNAPTGFASGTIRAIAPVLYTFNSSDQSSLRTKTPTVASATISSSVLFSVDENGRRYFSLPYRDVYSVQSVIYSTGTPATTFDVTEDFELDDGQRETHYENSRLYIKPDKVSLPRYNSPSSSVSLQVSLSYFVHGGLASAPFVGAASYIGVNYENIPLYTNPKTGKTVSLANCLDFRRSGLTATTPMLKPYGRSEFGILGDTEISYSHYLPRVDKLCVKSDPEDGSALFFLVHGTPDLAPVAPPDPADAMVIATITVPAYTHDAKSVVITPVDNKRYTMADIGKMEKRVDEVEVFAKLSLSESELEAKSLKTSNSETEPLKTSIFVDEFYGHSVADVVDSTYSCSIDYERGELRPFFTTTPVPLPSASLINTVQSSDGLVTLQYTETPYIQNRQYTTSLQINPSNTVNWLGYMTLSPSIDSFYDLSYRPVVKTNALMENDNWLSCNTNDARGFGTQWNDWESIWTGVEQIQEEQDDIQKRIVELPRSVSVSSVPSVASGSPTVGISRTVDSVNEKTSNYISARQLKNRIKKSVGSRVVDRSVVPYISSRTVTATVSGLKPNSTNLILTFDGQVLASGFSTDGTGSCVVEFTIPANTFLAGERIVRVADSQTTQNCTMAAEAVYYCTGLLEQRASGVMSTRPPVLRRQLPSSEAVAKDPFNRDIDSVENTHWSDPLSQTFFVDKKTNPNGIFLSSVSLYFAGKDSVLPVAVQIRPTVSGYPSPSVVVPFSTVVLPASGITSSPSLPTETKFTFSSPVYLEPGEYALCVLANSDDYRLFAAESGINGLANSDAVAGRAGNNQRVGTLYAPQGIGVAAEISGTDLMFTANRCEFVSSGTVRWSDVPVVQTSQLLKVYASEIIPEPSTVTRSVGSYTFPNNETVYFDSLLSSAPEMVYQMERGSDTTVSPVIDTGSMVVAGIQLNSANPQSASSRYVSRVVELPSEAASNGVRVYVDANVPLHSDDVVTVYCRWLLSGESNIFAKPWQLATRRTPQFTSSSEIDYRELEFMIETGAAQRNGKFTAYQIAVELKSPSVASPYRLVPSARNIRTVSYIK